MSDSRNQNQDKDFANSAKKILNEMGYQISQGHVYQFLAKLAGHKNWQAAKASSGLSRAIEKTGENYAAGDQGGQYEVKLVMEQGDLELKKYYMVNASSEKEAEEILNEYVSYRNGFSELTPRIKPLAESEDEREFQLGNWEVIYNQCPGMEAQKGSAVNLDRVRERSERRLALAREKGLA